MAATAVAALALPLAAQAGPTAPRPEVSWVDVSWVDVSWVDVSWVDVSWVDGRRARPARVRKPSKAAIAAAFRARRADLRLDR